MAQVNARQIRGDGTVVIDTARADRTIGSDAPRTKARTLPLHPELADWIERYVPGERRLAGGVLFVLPTTGRPWPESSLRRWWYAACDAARVPRVGLYEGTKHSTATNLRREGIGLDVIQAILGQADSRSTEKYARLSDQAVLHALVRRPQSLSAGPICVGSERRVIWRQCGGRQKGAS